MFEVQNPNQTITNRVFYEYKHSDISTCQISLQATEPSVASIQMGYEIFQCFNLIFIKLSQLLG